jgi:hypothetical protein
LARSKSSGMRISQMLPLNNKNQAAELSEGDLKMQKFKQQNQLQMFYKKQKLK